MPPEDGGGESQVHQMHALLVPAVPLEPLRRGGGGGTFQTAAPQQLCRQRTTVQTSIYRTAGVKAEGVAVPQMQRRLQLQQLPQGDPCKGH